MPHNPSPTNAGHADRSASALFYTVADLAHLLQVSKRHVWRMLDDGRLPQAVRLGRAVRWPRAAIDRWVAAGCPQAGTRG